jgi:hypothetical protein
MATLESIRYCQVTTIRYIAFTLDITLDYMFMCLYDYAEEGGTKVATLYKVYKA